MKKIVLSLIAIAIIFTSCEGFLNGSYDESPTITSSYFYVNHVLQGDSIVISAKDTLFTRSTDTEGQWRLDSLSLGDTVYFVPIFHGNGQNLTGVTIEWDLDRMDFTLGLSENFNKYLEANSNIEKGQLYFKPGVGGIKFPCTFVATQYGILPVKLTVSSPSQFSPYSIYLTIPIKK